MSTPESCSTTKVRGGNAAGIPIRHIGMNLDSNQSQGDNFIASFNLTTVWEDFDRTHFRQFESGFGQPLFVIINGVEGSPSHEQWEILYVLNNYGSQSSPIQTMRDIIDSVAAPEPMGPVNPFAEVYTGENNIRFTNGLGWIADTFFPWIYNFPLEDWIYVLPDRPINSLYVYVLPFERWIWVDDSLGGAVYDFSDGMWKTWPEL